MSRVSVQFSLLSAVLLIISCSRSYNTTVQERGSINPPTLRPKLTRSQGSDRYQEIRCGLQDKAGNLWFGSTGEGVYRYDGKGFAQFTVHDGLADNTVWSILEDTMGTIWFGTDSGLSRWDGKSIRSIPIVGATGSSQPTISGANQTHSGE